MEDVRQARLQRLSECTDHPLIDFNEPENSQASTSESEFLLSTPRNGETVRRTDLNSPVATSELEVSVHHQPAVGQEPPTTVSTCVGETIPETGASVATLDGTGTD